MSKERRVAHLFREMLRASNNFTDYNFRIYFARRVKEEFRKHGNIKSPEEQDKFIAEAEKTLGILQRQSALSQFYQGPKLPIE
ncbi:LYR motif containing protein 4 [Echinococcus multilocularis]|uniref:LYR motif containing protein 4 n=1 Tax=Echinococcus multilocularis TaxID=6211 RepID=A0A087VZY3_ECHMU|nr:LYR motif containing protein 4 [Echinococcus multilocularis]